MPGGLGSGWMKVEESRSCRQSRHINHHNKVTNLRRIDACLMGCNCKASTVDYLEVDPYNNLSPALSGSGQQPEVCRQSGLPRVARSLDYLVRYWTVPSSRAGGGSPPVAVGSARSLRLRQFGSQRPRRPPSPRLTQKAKQKGC